MNKLRHILAARIEANGGYSRNQSGNYPIAFNVKLYYLDLDVDTVYEAMCKEHGYLPPITGLAQEWDENRVWEWVSSDMWESLNDCDAYRSYGTHTAKKYGLPYHVFPKKYEKLTGDERCYYPAGKKGWSLKDPYEPLYFDVEFGCAGRSGGYIVIESFQGHKLNMSARELAREIRDNDNYNYGGYSNDWCRNLLAMLDEWEGMFTPKKASEEALYLAGSRMHQEQGDRQDAWREKRKAMRKAFPSDARFQLQLELEV